MDSRKCATCVCSSCSRRYLGKCEKCFDCGAKSYRIPRKPLTECPDHDIIILKDKKGRK